MTGLYRQPERHDSMSTHRHEPPKDVKLVPVFVVAVLLLLVLYVVSFLLLVWPDRLQYTLLDSRWEAFPKYRYGTESWAEMVYWPLEQIDRQLRPDEWQRQEQWQKLNR